jgi:lipoate---protein ligase
VKEKLEGQPIRLIDAGLTSPVFSQSIYHAVAHTMNGSSPDTVILVSPSDPYVSVGIHQDLEKEVDTEYCRSRGLTIIRREVGGGAVYLDRDQLFTQWVFRAGVLPARVGAQFELYVKPLVATYQDLGINAYYRPVNDVHVGGRKIAGTGAARIGSSDVIVGSFMFDFDRATMAKVLKVSSEKMRDKVSESLAQYVTTMADVLPKIPSREDVARRYVRHCEEQLHRPLVMGSLSEAELAKAREIDDRFMSDEWTAQTPGHAKRNVKIHQDVRVAEVAHKAPGGLIRVTARLIGDRVDQAELSGDFTCVPASGLQTIEESLVGCPLDAAALTQAVSRVLASSVLQLPGVSPEEIVAAMMLLRSS